ncbi:Uncharacterised protein [Streptococcus pneumoniae]|nr:Uncharacterised protein [Streptococcus pneumoniae]
MILKKDRKLQKIYKEDLKITVMIVILFENLFKPRQRRLTVGMVTDFVSFIHNLKTVF